MSTRTPDPTDFLYRVVEVGIDGTLQGDIISKADWPNAQLYPFNARQRIYPKLSTARTYKKRLAKEGRQAKILRFVYESEVE